MQPFRLEMKTEEHDKELRGVGMFREDAGKSLRSDKQLEEEAQRIVQQLLKTRGHVDASWKVDASADDGRMKLEGELPDRGTRRLLILALEGMDAVASVDASKLLPTSVSDGL